MGSPPQGDPSRRKEGGSLLLFLAAPGGPWAAATRSKPRLLRRVCVLCVFSGNMGASSCPGGLAPPAPALSPSALSLRPGRGGVGGGPRGPKPLGLPRAWVFRALSIAPLPWVAVKIALVAGRRAGVRFPCSWRNYRHTCCQEAWLGEASAAPSRRAGGGADGNSITRLSRLFDLF